MHLSHTYTHTYSTCIHNTTFYWKYYDYVFKGVAAGGLLDIIADHETGYLAENSDDMAEFSERVRQLTVDKDLRKRFGESSLAWAQVYLESHLCVYVCISHIHFLYAYIMNVRQSWSWEAATSLLRNVQYRTAIALHGARDEKGKHVPDIAAAILNHAESYTKQ